MKKYFKACFVCVSILPSLVYADWGVRSQVTRIVVTANGGINVRLSPELSGCQSQSGYGANYASVYPEHPGFSSIQANLLTAYASGKDVRLWFSDANCTVGEMVLGGAHND